MSTPTPAPPAPLRNSYWVLPGKVLAGEHPTAATVEATRERLQRLIDAGVECFIDLTEPGEVKPYDTEIPFSIEYLRKPIKDHGVPSQRAHMAEILDCIHDALQSGRCVYIHCRAGIGRTGTVIGCLLVERGFEGEGAIDELNRLWQQSERSQNWPSVPETDDQAGYVRKWKARAVFAEELSLASVAARNALVGKSGTAPAGPATGSTAGANALLGPGQAPGGTAADSSPGRAAGTALSGLGLPLLDDDDNEPSDFATFNAVRGGVPSGPATGGSPTPVAQPDQWPAFGKQPTPAQTGQGTQTRKVTPTSNRDAPKGCAAARDSAKGHAAAGGSARDPAAHSAGAAPGSARDSAAHSAGAAPGSARDPAHSAGVTPGSARDSAHSAGAAPGSARDPAHSAGVTPSSARDAAHSAGAAPGSARDSVHSAGVAPGSTRDPAHSAGVTPGSARDSAHSAGVTPGSARDPAHSAGAAPGSARDPAHSAGVTPSSTRDSVNTAAAQGTTRDPATGIAARAPTQPGAPAVITPNTAPDDDPLSDPEALSAARTLRDRFLGALLGLAVGDAVSAATQFRKPGTFTPVGDMIGGGPFDLPRGGWSDDTAMALCLADSLLERNGFDARDQMERYRKWQQEGYLTATGQCVGITASTARAIAMSAWRRGAMFGSHDPAQLDPEPLSRVAPAVLFFFAASGQAVDQATEAARTTCQAPAVLDSCRSLARALHAALSGQPKAIVLEKAVQAIGPGTGPGRTATGISASAALTAAVAAFGATANFRDAVLYAANLGGDSDVISAVCGQLAGAYYSVKAIPTSWHNGLMQKELIVSYADRLLAHAMLGMSG